MARIFLMRDVHGFPILWNLEHPGMRVGRVVAVGKEVDMFKPGERVAALSFTVLLCLIRWIKAVRF